MNTPAHATHATIEELGAIVRAAVGGAAVFQVINTRFIIQLGVDLKAPTAAQNTDAALMRQVEDALRRMGIKLGGQP
jgi:hypothetical protein